MKVVIAVDSFKGSCSAEQACTAIALGMMRYQPNLQIEQFPIADGGEGLLQVLKKNGILQQQNPCVINVTGPYQQTVSAPYLCLSDNRTAVLEMALTSGLELTPKFMRCAGKATSYGLGQLLKRVLQQGYRHIIIGLGGSATNDGGIGFAQALGVKFYDKAGKIIASPACGFDLTRVARVDLSELYPAIHDAVIEASCDVNNPLLGEMGATWIYGRQKGATDDELMQLEEGMKNFNQVMTETIGHDISLKPGCGAAGGMGAALNWFTNGKLRSGIELVLDRLGIRKAIEQTDLVITGEGKLDKQSSFGKAPIGVAKLARYYHKPVIAICGTLGDDAEILHEYIDAMWSICSGPMTLEQAMEHGEVLLAKTAEQIIRTVNIGCGLGQ